MTAAVSSSNGWRSNRHRF